MSLPGREDRYERIRRLPRAEVVCSPPRWWGSLLRLSTNGEHRCTRWALTSRGTNRVGWRLLNREMARIRSAADIGPSGDDDATGDDEAPHDGK